MLRKILQLVVASFLLAGCAHTTAPPSECPRTPPPPAHLMNPPAELETLDPDKPATDIDALQTVTKNYRRCVEDGQRLMDLQGYVQAVCLDRSDNSWP